MILCLNSSVVLGHYVWMGDFLSKELGKVDGVGVIITVVQYFFNTIVNFS